MQFLLIKFVFTLACEYLLPKVFYYGYRIIHGRASPWDILGNVTLGVTFHEFSMLLLPYTTFMHFCNARFLGDSLIQSPV